MQQVWRKKKILRRSKWETLCIWPAINWIVQHQASISEEPSQARGGDFYLKDPFPMPLTHTHTQHPHNHHLTADAVIELSLFKCNQTGRGRSAAITMATATTTGAVLNFWTHHIRSSSISQNGLSSSPIMAGEGRREEKKGQRQCPPPGQLCEGWVRVLKVVGWLSSGQALKQDAKLNCVIPIILFTCLVRFLSLPQIIHKCNCWREHVLLLNTRGLEESVQCVTF